MQESVRGCDVFLVQPTAPPVNDNLMELLLCIDACRRASARSITAVLPYYGYARADRKTAGRESIAAKLTANLITEAGADRVLAMDLHSGQTVGDTHEQPWPACSCTRPRRRPRSCLRFLTHPAALTASCLLPATLTPHAPLLLTHPATLTPCRWDTLTSRWTMCTGRP